MASHFLIAAPHSGSGKTTLTLGLLRALRHRGLTVQPFKCGPDYIDIQHHRTAAGRASINLDLFMASPKHLKTLYQMYRSGADVSLTEGVMGLFDGADRMQASSASLAECLGIPIILVVQAKAMAYSAAPLLYGFKHFYAGIQIAGVLFNGVQTTSHFRFLEEACQDVGLPCLGYFPTHPDFTIPSRHLGLRTSSEIDYERIIEAIARKIPQTIDLDRLLALTKTDEEAPLAQALSHRTACKVTIARDEAFSFQYHQNLAVLEALAEVQYVSPLWDTELPETDLLYLPGGYPELHAQTLSANTTFRESVRAYCQNGGYAYAECGGLMYLGRQLTDAEGHSYPMAGVFPFSTSLQHAKLTLGYRQIHFQNTLLKGHEFHYSTLQEAEELSSLAPVRNARGLEVGTKIYRVQNTLASYVHLYWGDGPPWLTDLLRTLSTSLSTHPHG